MTGFEGWGDFLGERRTTSRGRNGEEDARGGLCTKHSDRRMFLAKWQQAKQRTLY